MAVLGPAVGNYATSVVFRLPFGQTPFEKNPYCGSCGTMLAPKDLFPILSYVLLKGRCRYCATTIRSSYTMVEVACGILFIVNFLVYRISEDFLLITSIGVFWVILAALEYHEKKLYLLILTYVAALGALLRVLHEGTIYGFFYSCFAMLFVSVLIWKILAQLKPALVPANPKTPPGFLWLAVLMGIVLPLAYLPAATALAMILYVAMRALPCGSIASAAVGVSVYAGVLAGSVDWLGRFFTLSF